MSNFSVFKKSFVPPSFQNILGKYDSIEVSTRTSDKLYFVSNIYYVI